MTIRTFYTAAHNFATAARALWDAHEKTHSEKEPPLKYGMNYGELVALKIALDEYDRVVELSMLRSAPKAKRPE